MSPSVPGGAASAEGAVARVHPSDKPSDCVESHGHVPTNRLAHSSKPDNSPSLMGGEHVGCLVGTRCEALRLIVRRMDCGPGSMRARTTAGLALILLHGAVSAATVVRGEISGPGTSTQKSEPDSAHSHNHCAHTLNITTATILVDVCHLSCDSNVQYPSLAPTRAPLGA